MMSGKDRWTKWVFSLLIFVFVYSLYHLTSFPNVTGGDSGELLAEACVRVMITYLHEEVLTLH